MLTIKYQALTERNKLLQENLDHTKLDLERNLRWTRSSEILTQIQERQTTSRSGIGFEKQNNPVSHTIHMYKSLCTRYGNSGHLKNQCKALFEAFQKNVKFTKRKRLIRLRIWFEIKMLQIKGFLICLYGLEEILFILLLT